MNFREIRDLLSGAFQGAIIVIKNPNAVSLNNPLDLRENLEQRNMGQIFPFERKR